MYSTIIVNYRYTGLRAPGLPALFPSNPQTIFDAIATASYLMNVMSTRSLYYKVSKIQNFKISFLSYIIVIRYLTIVYVFRISCILSYVYLILILNRVCTSMYRRLRLLVLDIAISSHFMSRSSTGIIFKPRPQ